MSRSGYTDDDDDGTGGLWRGAVQRAIKGKRGQAFLRELAAAMDAMPVKELAAESFQQADGQYCTLGTVGAARGINMRPLEEIDDPRVVGKAFGISMAMAAEIMYMNDERFDGLEWENVEICGPMRPYYPDWGQHTYLRSRPFEGSEGQGRWAFMRKWVAENTLPAAAAKPPKEA